MRRQTYPKVPRKKKKQYIKRAILEYSESLIKFGYVYLLKVTSPVTGHDVTFPETVLITTEYVFPGSKLSLNSQDVDSSLGRGTGGGFLVVTNDI